MMAAPKKQLEFLNVPLELGRREQMAGVQPAGTPTTRPVESGRSAVIGIVFFRRPSYFRRSSCVP